MLRVRQPIMRGSAVKRVQEMLQLLGFNHFGWMNGHYDAETAAAIRRFQKHRALQVDGICGPLTLAGIRDAVDEYVDDAEVLLRIRKPVAMGYTGEIPPDPGIVDITGTHTPPRNAVSRPRGLSIVDAILLHQTGCEMPRKPQGWGKVNAHYGITQEGVAIAINPIEMMIWHAQGLSKRSVGIEIEGNYPGLDGEPSTLWTPGGGPHTLGWRMVEAAHRILADILHQTEIAHVYAHRQSSVNRPADPGEAIWSQIGGSFRHVLQCREADLSQRFGDGSREIPAAWDENATGEYR